MKTLDMAQATAPLAEYAKEVSREPVIVTVRGKPVAALVSVEDADWESISLSTDPRFLVLIEGSRAQIKAEGGISEEEMRRRVALRRAKQRD